MSHHLPSHGVLICFELQLAIIVSLEGKCLSLEGVKVGGYTVEGHILELEGGCGGLGTCLLSQLQEEEVCGLDHI